MRKLIHADLYRLFRRPYLFVLTGILCALAVLFNLMFSTDASIQKTFQFSLNYLKFLPLFEVMIVDIVMAEENKFSTLKNTISSGFGKCVYTGKLIPSLILTAFCDGIAFVFYLCSAFLRLHGNDLTSAFMGDYLLRIAVALLFIVGAMFVAMVFAVAFQKNAVYIFAFIGFILILPLVFEGFGIRIDIFRLLYKITIFGQTEDLYDIKNAQLIRMKFSEITAASESEILSGQHEKDIELAKSKYEMAKAHLLSKQKELDDYKSETLKIIRGESRMSVDLLNTMVAETEAQIKDAQSTLDAADLELKAFLESRKTESVSMTSC